MTESTPKSSSNSMVFLIVAILLGVIATAVAFIFLNAQGNKASVPTISVYVAKRTIPVDAILDLQKDIELRPYPVSDDDRAFFSDCFTKDLPPPLKQRINRTIRVGSPILKSDVSGFADLHLAAVPPKSAPMCGLAIPAKGADALAGILVPGDRVKIMVTRPVIVTVKAGTQPAAENSLPLQATDKGATYHTTILLKGDTVRVLAVGARLSLVRQQATAAEQFEATKDAQNLSTVMLEVTEDQAKEILEETGHGVWPATLLWVSAAPPPEAQPAGLEAPK